MPAPTPPPLTSPQVNIVDPTAQLTARIQPQTPTKPPQATKHKPNPNPTRKNSVTNAKPMDGAKIAELSQLKLKQMDSVSKKMKATYAAAKEQKAKDLKELEQIEHTIETLKSRLDPLLVKYKERLEEKRVLQKRYEEAVKTMREMMVTQKGTMHKVRKSQQCLEKKNASEVLEEKKGFTVGRNSTYTNKMMLQEMWAKAATIDANLVKDNLGKKVVFDKTIEKEYNKQIKLS